MNEWMDGWMSCIACLDERNRSPTEQSGIGSRTAPQMFVGDSIGDS